MVSFASKNPMISSSTKGISSTPHDPTEQTLLLPKDSKPRRSSNDNIEQNAEVAQDELNEQSEASLAEEPGTAKLIIVLGSIWIGVFLAALGWSVSCDRGEQVF